MIIHISGFTGSGKSTLGDKLRKKFKSKIVVKDTNEFIQPNTKEGKYLLSLDYSPSNRIIYKKLWKQTLKEKFAEFIESHPNKIIIFVGSLDSFSWEGEIYKISADHKIVLDICTEELYKRYYTRIAKNKNPNYWRCLIDGDCGIYGSRVLLHKLAEYNQWYKNNDYKFMTDVKIIELICRLVK